MNGGLLKLGGLSLEKGKGREGGLLRFLAFQLNSMSCTQNMLV